MKLSESKFLSASRRIQNNEKCSSFKVKTSRLKIQLFSIKEFKDLTCEISYPKILNESEGINHIKNSEFN